MTRPSTRPRWHLIYYVLAMIDVLTIVGSLFLNHSVLGIHRQSVELNQEWALHLADLLRLSDLAQQVNAPGNDVFDSHDVDKETATRDRALDEFSAHMARTRQSLHTSSAGERQLLLLTALDTVDAAMTEMTATADQIFVYFRNKDPARAAAYMASMDRSYANVTRQIGETQRLLQEIQLGNSESQLAEAGRLGRFEFLIGFVIVVIVNLVIVYGHKIKTSMAAAEAQRQELIDRLTISEAAAQSRLHDAIENMNEGFSLFDGDDRLVICNDRSREFLGLDRQSMRVGDGFAGILRRGATHNAYPEAEGRLDQWLDKHLTQRRDGTTRLERLAGGRWIQICERRTTDGGTVGIWTDVSQLKQQEILLRDNEQRLNHTIEHLEESRLELQAMADRFSEIARENQVQRDSAEAASAAKSQFLANVSHELRTPLNAIIGFSEIMKAEMIGPLGMPQYRQYSADIHDSGNHLLSLINDLLDLAKIEACKHELDDEVCSLQEIAEACVRLMSERAHKAGVAIVSAIDSGLPPVRADERKIKQVLLNLLSNALKFTPDGGTIDVTISASDTGGTIIAVTDTGIGIPPHQLSHVLEPFVQVDNAYTRRHAGTGLGLPLSKAFAELHGGSLTLRSEVGVGTSVTVTLPPERTVKIPAAAGSAGVSAA